METDERIEFRNGMIALTGTPCPRCGKETVRLHTWLFKKDGSDERTPRHYVDCSGCGAVAPWKDTPEDAAKAFRAGEAPVGSLADRENKIRESSGAGETSGSAAL